MTLPTNLWDKAFQSLSQGVQSNLNAVVRTQPRDILDAVLKDAEAKRMQSLRKRWKYTKPNGDVIIVRDVLEKIVRWVDKFKETGDIVMQYDPGHAALPWAAVRFLLHIAVSEVQIFAALSDDLEYITRMMVRYRNFEKLYLRGSQSDIEEKLADTLVSLYAEILTHLSIAVKFFQENTLISLLKSPFRSVDEGRAKTMKEREAEVDAFARLADADTLQSLEAGFMRLSAHVSRELSQGRYNDILEWLSVSPYHLHHQFLSQSRLPNAGQWLHSHPEYIQWETASFSSLILLDGIPGCGKSTLCSVVVDSLLVNAKSNPSAAPFAYFYCSNSESEKDRRSSNSVMRTILFQLAIDPTHQTKMRDFLCAEYERQLLRARAGKLDMPKLTAKDCVRLMLELAEEDPMTIVIDAIDSIDDLNRPILIQSLREIVSKADNVVNVLATSRSSSRAAEIPVAEFQIHITNQETRGDMEIFVDHLVDNAVASKLLLEGKLCADTRELLKHELLTGAGEMFLWARLQFERICRETVEVDLITVLQRELPEDIDQLYQESLRRIWNSADTAREVATQTISWLLFMREPLTPSALLTALVGAKHRVLDLDQIMATCSNFIVLDTKCNVMRFAHQSAQDFLVRHPTFAASKAHRLLAACCVDASSRGPSAIFDRSLKVPNDDFYVYAAMYWPIHIEISHKLEKDAAAAKDLIHDVKSFMFDEDWELTLSFESWISNVRNLARILPRDHSMKTALCAIPEGDFSFLFVLSLFGLDDILVSTLSGIGGLDLNQQNEQGHTPVYLASAFGHLRTLETLIDHDAHVNVECGKYGSPLHVACFHGYLEVVTRLLQLGAQIYCGSVFRNALEAAFRGGKEDVALYLVNLNQNVESEDDHEEALGQAALLGFVKVVQRLQFTRQSSLAGNKPEKMKRKIRKAIQGGQVGVLRQLIGRDATLSNDLPSAAVALATVHNQKDMIEFLLDQGMDLEAEWDFGSPLRTASLLNFQFIVRLLIARGAEVNANGSLGAALQAAALNGHTSVARLLIQEGANVNQYTGFYGSALQAAAFHGHVDTVELLIDSNADIYGHGYASSALDAAAKGGHEDIIVLILRKKRQPQPHLEDPSCGMHHAEQYEELLRNASTGRVQSPDPDPMEHCHGANKTMTAMDTLFKATDSDDPIDLLRVEYSSRFGSTEKWEEIYPLVAAASSGDDAIFYLLLRKHQELLDASDDRIRTCISVALKQGHISIVHTLLDCLLDKARTKGSPREVHIALKLASGYLTAGENKALASKFPDLGRRHSDHTRETKEKKLVDLDTLLAMSELDVALEICGSHGLTTFAQQLLETPILRNRKPQSGQAAFVSAAESGYVDTMRLFVSHWPALGHISEAVGRALIESSRHGHIAAVRYLVLELGADVNAAFPGRGTSHEYGLAHNLQYRRGLELNFSSTHVPMLQGNRSAISPLQAGLHGFVDRFRSPGGTFQKRGSREVSQHQQEEVIYFLLENGANPKDPGRQRVFPIQVAAKFCSTHILQSLILAGADVNAAFPLHPVQASRPEQHVYAGESYRSALFEAAGIELRGLPMLHRLVASGAAFPEDLAGQNHLLGQALGFFRSTSHRATPRASSLEAVFTEGPGAVLFFLLSQMPQAKAIDTRWNLVLQMAVFSKQDSFVELLLSRGVDVNGQGYYHGSALQAAARGGNTTLAQKLLDAGAEVNATGGAWHTALRAAIVDGYETTAQLLVDRGANLKNDLTRYGEHQASAVESMSTLQLAARTGNVDIVTSILAIGADPTLEVLEGSQHPLTIAAGKGAIQVVEALLNAGAPVNIHSKPSHLNLPVHAAVASPIHAASFAGQLDTVSLLIRSGADLECDFDGSGTPLSAGASSGNVQVVRQLISAGATISDSAALENAVQRNHFEVLKVLLDSGATAKGAISLACSIGNSDIVKILIEKALESDPIEPIFDEAYSADGLSESMTRLLLEYGTPTTYQFLLACAKSSLGSVDLLLQQKIFDINQADERSGDYPLQIAALHLRTELVRTLVSLGANIDCESPNHGTPLHTALKACTAPILRAMKGEGIRRILDQIVLPAPPRRPLCDSMAPPDEPKMQQKSDCKRIVKHLVAQGANIAQSCPFLGPPLHLACLLGMEILVAPLLTMNQNLNSTAGHFEQPLFAAIQGRHPHIISLLPRHSSTLTHVHSEYGTVLHHACRVYDGPSARLLLQQGADATGRDFRGQTPLTVALQGEVDIRSSRTSLDEDSQFFEHLLTSKRKALRRSGREGQMRQATPLNMILELAKRLYISDEDLTAAADLSRGPANKRHVLSQLLCMDSNRLAAHHRPAIDALEMVLGHDPSTRVTPRIFLHIFRTGSSPALRLLNLLESYGKRVYSTTDVQAAIDDAYGLESQVAMKKRFSDLLTRDESEWDSAGSEDGWDT